MSVRLLARSLPFVAVLAMLAAPAMAQTQAPAPAAATPPASPAATALPAPTAKTHPVIEKRIEMLRTTMKITPEQTKAFNEFAQVMRDNANKMDAMIGSQAKTMPTMTAVDHMKAYEAITQAHADDMQREVPAFSRLYETLSPAQKKAADDSFRDAAAGRKPR